jgi:hypothetical protein
MGPTALLLLRRKACWGFFRPKNPTASAGCEPANLGTKGQHATSRTPRPLKYPAWKLQYFCTIYYSIIYGLSGSGTIFCNYLANGTIFKTIRNWQNMCSIFSKTLLEKIPIAKIMQQNITQIFQLVTCCALCLTYCGDNLTASRSRRWTF